jgi:hypothetical protein
MQGWLRARRGQREIARQPRLVPMLLRLCGGVQQVYAVFGDAFRHDCLTGWVCPGQAQTIGEEVVAGPGKKEIGLGVFEVVWDADGQGFESGQEGESFDAQGLRPQLILPTTSRETVLPVKIPV